MIILILERSEGIICAGLNLDDALLALKMRKKGMRRGDDALSACAMAGSRQEA